MYIREKISYSSLPPYTMRVRTLRKSFAETMRSFNVNESKTLAVKELSIVHWEANEAFSEISPFG